jgi:hypothetical protein
MNSMAVDNANRAVAEMRQQYSDFQSLEDQIGTIVRASPKLTLTQAYHLAKIEQNGGQPAVAPRQAAPQPTESGPGGGGARSSETPDPIARAQEAMKRLPPGNNQLEDSIRLAWDAALEKHGSQ